MWGSFRRTALVNFEPAEGFFARIWTLLFLYQKVLSFPCSKLVIKKKKKMSVQISCPQSVWKVVPDRSSGGVWELKVHPHLQRGTPPPPPIFPKGLGST